MHEHFGPSTAIGTAIADAPGVPAAHVDEHLGLGVMLRERVINLKTMPWPLRLLTLLVFVQLLAVGILTALRDRLAHVAMASTSATGVPLQIPQAIFFAILASFVLAWACALTGALHSHGFVSLFVLWAFTLLVVSAQQPGVIGEIQAGLVALIWLWAGVIWLLRRRATLRDQPRVGRGPALVTFVLMLAVLAAYYLLLYRQNPASLADTVSAQMLVLLYLLLPVLFLAGTDIAEVGQSAAGLVGRLTHRGRPTWLLPFLTLLVALGALVYALAYVAGGLDRLNGLSTLAPSLLLLVMPGLAAILLLALVAALGRVGRWPPMNVPFSALAVSIVPVLFVVATVTVFYQPGEPFAVYQHGTGQLHYSLAYPATWSPTALQEGSDTIPTEAVFNGTQDTQLPGAFFVFGSKPVPGATNDLSPSDVDGAAQQVLVPTFSTSAATATIALSESPQQGQWYVRGFTVTYPDQSQPVSQGVVWLQVVNEHAWLLAGYAAPSQLSADLPMFTRMVTSWQPDLSAQVPSGGPAVAPVKADQRLLTALGLAPFALGVVVGMPLVLLGRRRGRKRTLAGLFFVVVALEGAYTAAVALLSRDTPLSVDPRLALHAFQLVVAVATLLLIAALAVRRLRNPTTSREGTARLLVLAFGLNAGLLIVDTASTIFGGVASSVQKFTLAQTALLIGAAFWDLAMSGEQVTNVEGRSVPRTSRVLIYLGYTMVVATLVLFLSSLYVTSGLQVALPDTVSQLSRAGLYFLGVPLLVTVTILGLSRVVAGRTPISSSPLPATRSERRVLRFAAQYGLLAAAIVTLSVLAGAIAMTLAPSTIPAYQHAYAGYQRCLNTAAGSCAPPQPPALGIVFDLASGVALVIALALAVAAAWAAARAAGRARTGVAAAILTAACGILALAAANAIAGAANVTPLFAAIPIALPTFTSSSYAYSFDLGVGLGMGLLSLALLLLAIPFAALLGWVSAAIGARRHKAHLPAPPPAPLAEV